MPLQARCRSAGHKRFLGHVGNVEADAVFGRCGQDVPLRRPRSTANSLSRKFLTGGKSGVRLLADRPQDRLLGPFRQFRTKSRGCGGSFSIAAAAWTGRRRPESPPPSEHFKDNQRQGVLVRLGVRRPAVRLFGRRVGRRAGVHPGLDVVRHVQSQAQVQNLALAALGQADVLRFQIAVNDAVDMGEIQCGRQVADDRKRFIEGDPTAAFDDIPQRFAFDVLEDGVGLVVMEAEIENRRDVLVREPAPSFASCSSAASKSIIPRRKCETTFIATGRSSRRSLARKTRPIAPLPNVLWRK